MAVGAAAGMLSGGAGMEAAVSFGAAAGAVEAGVVYDGYLLGVASLDVMPYGALPWEKDKKDSSASGTCKDTSKDFTENNTGSGAFK